MSTTYHLRPVSDISPSSSPTASTTSPGDHSPHYKPPMGLSPPPPPSATTNGRLRRPLSPSSLRDVDLSQTPDMTHRKYPTPPTGHDLMAMFPPAPPDNFPEMRPGPTSGFFQRQERAFFAQAGKEIVRVRVEVDFPHGAEPEPVKSRSTSTNRPWLTGPSSSSSSAPHHSPVQPSSTPILYPHPPSRPTQRGTISVTPAPLFPPSSSHTPPTTAQPPPNLHPPPLHQSGSGQRTPPQDSTPSGPASAKPEYPAEEYDPDESWRRPMPYAERRRAGKHTRRVIVRT
ncbi:hypothetical protein GALMADRAFT_224670 [Galerina marginata CBS 339.88]|uniref:Uncharacterized protein n=1 Tax=Galerina marginata (strain CBS 339.88) TaxID=685588 RepID=A0A067T7F3_GALM3|nr:hypothetical protein GALMADRAFT_224670 [Galerina marginata CBS 339.88]